MAHDPHLSTDTDPAPLFRALSELRSRFGTRATDEALSRLRISPAGRAKVLAGLPLADEDVDPDWRSSQVGWLRPLPRPVLAAVWSSYPPRAWSPYQERSGLPTVLDRAGPEAAARGLAALWEDAPQIMALAPDVDSPLLVAPALRLRRYGPTEELREAGSRWLHGHRETAEAVALPLAVGDDPRLREAAATWLRAQLALHRNQALHEVAARYGPDLVDALRTLQHLDPVLDLPPAVPRPPRWASPAALRRPVLADGGGALPVPAAETLLVMLMLSAPGAPYAGLARVGAVCSRRSLAAFAEDVADRWETAGAPARHSWALEGLAHLGDDRTAHRIGSLARRWSVQRHPGRAKAAVALLAALGGEAAAAELTALAERGQGPALRRAAREALAGLPDRPAHRS